MADTLLEASSYRDGVRWARHSPLRRRLGPGRRGRGACRRGAAHRANGHGRPGLRRHGDSDPPAGRSGARVSEVQVPDPASLSDFRIQIGRCRWPDGSSPCGVAAGATVASARPSSLTSRRGRNRTRGPAAKAAAGQGRPVGTRAGGGPGFTGLGVTGPLPGRRGAACQ